MDLALRPARHLFCGTRTMTTATRPQFTCRVTVVELVRLLGVEPGVFV